MASWSTEPTPIPPTTRETLEQALEIAEKLIGQGRKDEALEIVRRVNDVSQREAMRRLASGRKGSA